MSPVTRRGGGEWGNQNGPTIHLVCIKRQSLQDADLVSRDEHAASIFDVDHCAIGSESRIGCQHDLLKIVVRPGRVLAHLTDVDLARCERHAEDGRSV